MGDNDLSSKPCFAFVVKPLNVRRAVLIAELIDDLSDRQRKLPEEDARPELAIVIEIVFTEARVIAMNNVVEVFVDHHDRRAEDHEVEVDRSN